MKDMRCLTLAASMTVLSPVLAFATPADSTVALRNAHTLIITGRASQARDLLLPVVQAEPGNFLARRYLASAMARAGQHYEAVQHLNLVFASGQGAAADRVTAGQSCLALGMNTEAARYFQEALRQDPGMELATCGLVKTYVATARLEEAKLLCEQSLRSAKDKAVRQFLSSTLESLQNGNPQTEGQTEGHG